MQLIPLGDRVVLKQLEAEETTKSGIVLPGQCKDVPGKFLSHPEIEWLWNETEELLRKRGFQR